LIDSTQTDSLFQSSNDYYISNWTGSSFPYTTTPQYNYTQYTQQDVTYLSTISETLSQSGSGSLALSHPFSSGSIAKTQYLWTAAELTSAGLTSGNITGLGLDISSLGSSVDNLRIKIKSTSQTVLNANSPELSGFTEVYFLNSTFAASGLHRFNFLYSV
jgi:hypothetical protein